MNGGSVPLADPRQTSQQWARSAVSGRLLPGSSARVRNGSHSGASGSTLCLKVDRDPLARQESLLKAFNHGS